MKSVMAAAALAVVAGACAPQPVGAPPMQTAAAQQARECFHTGSVTNYRQVDDRHVDLTVGVNRVYRVEMFGACPDVDWASRIAVVSRSGGSFICRGQDLELIVPRSGIGPDRCPGRSIRQLTPEEIAAERAARR
ncbi:MAG TPA: DUF6491 family protein [Caulobacteraceae bacterium]|jgi:hypothetical protein